MVFPWPVSQRNPRNQFQPGVISSGDELGFGSNHPKDARWKKVYPLAIKNGSGKSPMNGDFNANITQKWSTFHCHVWLPQGTTILGGSYQFQKRFKGCYGHDWFLEDQTMNQDSCAWILCCSVWPCSALFRAPFDFIQCDDHQRTPHYNSM